MILILNQIKIVKDERIFIVQKIKMIKNKFTLQAAPGPVTALASFPGSGNTWLRYLLQQVDDNDCMIYISVYKGTNLKIYGSRGAGH